MFILLQVLSHSYNNFDLQHLLYFEDEIGIFKINVDDPELWDVLIAKFEKSSALAGSCKDDAFCKCDHDDHQRDDAPHEGRKMRKGKRYLKAQILQEALHQNNQLTTPTHQHHDNNNNNNKIRMHGLMIHSSSLVLILGRMRMQGISKVAIGGWGVGCVDKVEKKGDDVLSGSEDRTQEDDE
ncbi:hypothetical protein Tco_1312253 [Tanacetum coccineum]